MAFLFRHAAIAGRRTRAHLSGGPAQGLLRVGAEGAETHSCDGDGDLDLDRLFREPGAEGDVGLAFLTVPFEGIARYRGAEKHQVVESRQAPLGAKPPDFINALVGGPMDFGEHFGWKRGRLSEGGSIISHRMPF